jgi:DNA polymerase-3 subunit delta'
VLPWLVQGHEDVRALLPELNARALLFTGPEGVGRRQVARWYSAFLNCSGPAGQQPCGECPSCRLWFSGGHPDYREVTPQLTTAQGRLNRRPEIRINQLVTREGQEGEPLAPWLEKRPVERVRIGVIDGADRLTVAAANSFLKMLEEPPSYSRIILIAPAGRALLPTLTSRCVVIRFGTVPTGGLEPAGHPAHHLGAIGPLLLARQQPEAFQEALDVTRRFVTALEDSLEESQAAAQALEKAWTESQDWDYAQLLREQLRSRLAPAAFAQAADVLADCEERLAAYVSPGVALQLLALQLRRQLH